MTQTRKKTLNLFRGTVLFKRLTVIVSLTIAGTLLGPVLTKLQGEYLAAWLISGLAVVRTSHGMLQPWLGKLPLIHIFWSLIAFVLVQIVSIFCYVGGILDEINFLLVFLIAGCFVGAFGTAYLLVIKNGIAAVFISYFKDWQLTVAFAESFATLSAGGVITVILWLYDIKVGLTLGGCVLIVSVIVDIMCLKEVWWLHQRATRIVEKKEKK